MQKKLNSQLSVTMSGDKRKILLIRSSVMSCGLLKILIHKSAYAQYVCMLIILLLSKRYGFLLTKPDSLTGAAAGCKNLLPYCNLW